ncbi:MAG: ThiF family adenylyltransferase, partial [Stellaceae bacterium]
MEWMRFNRFVAFMVSVLSENRGKPTQTIDRGTCNIPCGTTFVSVTTGAYGGGCGEMSDPYDRNILFCRMVGLLTQEQLDSLAHKTVAVGGAGGVGFTHAESIVRQGIGRVKISDFDTFGAENMGRQFGCTTLTVGRPKAEVLEERLMSINPALKVERFGALTRDNIDEFLD